MALALPPQDPAPPPLRLLERHPLPRPAAVPEPRRAAAWPHRLGRWMARLLAA